MSKLMGLKKDRSIHAGIVCVIIAILTLACLFSTFAKYVTSGNYEDEARVAKWGINVPAEEKLDLFDAIYKDPTDQSVTVHGLDDDGKDTNVIAPGTNKDWAINVLQADAIPEVMYNFEANLSVDDVDSSTIAALDENNSFLWRLQKPGDTSVREFQKFSELQKAVNDMSQDNIAPNHLPDGFSVGANPVTIGWQWIFDRGTAGSDYRDTRLGNLIADGKLDTFKVTLSFRATQVLEDSAILRFDVNGVGTEPGWQTVKPGTLAQDPATLGWKGPDDYTFEGWYKDNDTFTEPWDFATDVVPANGATVYAKWHFSGGETLKGYVRLVKTASSNDLRNAVANEEVPLNDAMVVFRTENHDYIAEYGSGREEGWESGEYRIDNVRPGEVGEIIISHYAFDGDIREAFTFEPDVPGGDQPADLKFDTSKDKEKNVEIHYVVADPSSGTVNYDTEYVKSLTGPAPQGSTFSANNGYTFHNWTKDGEIYPSPEEPAGATLVPNDDDIRDSEGFRQETTFVANSQIVVTFKISGRANMFDALNNDVKTEYGLANKGDFVVTTNNQVSDANAPENAPTVSFETEDGTLTNKYYAVGEDGFTFQGWDENIKQITSPVEFNVYFAKHKSLRDYTLTELNNAANDLATNKENSIYYKEFCEYEEKGMTDDGADNGTSRVEPYHWAIDSQGRTYGQTNFQETAETTCEFRIIGINKDFTTLDRSADAPRAGLTLMATHRMPSTQQYNSSNSEETWTNGGYGHRTCTLRNNIATGLPSALTERTSPVVPVYKYYGPTYNDKNYAYTQDKFWIISAVEATGSAPGSLYPYEEEITCKYPELVKRIKPGVSGPLQHLELSHNGTPPSPADATYAWTRSLYDKKISGNVGGACVIDTSKGDVPDGAIGLTGRSCVVPCFCLGQNSTYSVTLSSVDDANDNRIAKFVLENGTKVDPGTKITDIAFGKTFKFKVELKDESTVGFNPTLKSVKIGNETLTPSGDGFYEIPYITQDKNVVASTKFLRDYTLEEMQVISNSIASQKEASPYYKEMNVYLDKGTTADGRDNGTSTVEPYHWAIDANNRTYGQDGFNETANTTCEFRIIGMNVDNLNEAKNQKAGMTFMATHRMPNTQSYNSSSDEATWTNGGYGHSTCTLRTNAATGIPSALQNAAVPVYKGYGTTYNADTLKYVAEKFWSISCLECGNTYYLGGYPYIEEITCQYPKLVEKLGDNNGPLQNLHKSHNGQASINHLFWIRSMYTHLSDRDNLGQSLLVNCDNGQVDTVAKMQGSTNVVPCFCLGKADLSLTLNSGDLQDDQRIQNFIDENGNEITPGTKLTGFEPGDTFRFKVNWNKDYRLHSVKVDNQVVNPDKDGFYSVTLNNDSVVAAQTKYMRDYTLDELTAISNDIAREKENSQYYVEFNDYLNKGTKADGSDNGTSVIEPYHWAIDANGKTYSEIGFTNNANTCEFRVIGMNVDNIDQERTKQAGLTFMATHSTSTTTYNPSTSASAWTNGGYGVSTLKNNIDVGIPDALKNVAVPVYKGYGTNYSGSDLASVNDKFWAISMREAWGRTFTSGSYPYVEESTCKYPRLAELSTNERSPLAGIGKNHMGTVLSANGAWTRSMYYQLQNRRGAAVLADNSTGAVSYYLSMSQGQAGIAPCFCLGQDELSVTLSSGDVASDSRIEKFTNEDGTIDYPVGTKIDGLQAGAVFKFKVVLKDEASYGYKVKLQSVKADGETMTPAVNGVYTLTLGNSDVIVNANSKYLRDYTLEELTNAANDIAQNSTESEYYKEFSDYMNKGVKANGSDNGTGSKTGGSEPYHWAIDANGKTFSEIGFANTDSTSEFRIIGMGVDNIDEAKTKHAGLTFMATHRLTATSQYNPNDSAASAYTNGGYGQANCLLRNTLSNGNGLPRALYDAAVPVYKGYGTTYNRNSLGYVQDKFWAPSMTEATGTYYPAAAYPYQDEKTCIYPALATGVDSWKPLTGIGKTHLGNSESSNVWMRSMYYQLRSTGLIITTNHGQAMCIDSATGKGTSYNIMQTSYAVCPCFCLGE